jgi:hypothetical protein
MPSGPNSFSCAYVAFNDPTLKVDFVRLKLWDAAVLPFP